MSSAKNIEPRISVAGFVELMFENGSAVEILAGRGGLSERFIRSDGVQKFGLPLAGFSENIAAGQIQIVGQSEISYFSQLTDSQKTEVLSRLDFEKICCVLITKNLEPPAELLAIAEQNELPVLRCALAGSPAIRVICDVLSNALAAQTTLHGVLVGMYGIGVLLVGESGIGKSECALDLISSGHQLVSDDAVAVKKIGGALVGSSPELTYEHLEVRGLGIINVRSLYGVWSVAPPKKIVLYIELKKWSRALEVDRLGLETQEEEILGVKVAKFTLPVSAGRNLATLVETAVRVYLLRIRGSDGEQVNAAQKLIERHDKQLRMNKLRIMN